MLMPTTINDKNSMHDARRRRYATGDDYGDLA